MRADRRNDDQTTAPEPHHSQFRKAVVDAVEASGHLTVEQE
jgi:hypothetical protein